MKKSEHIRVLIVAVLLMLYHNLLAQDSEYSWKFPIKPGSQEWQSKTGFIDKLSLLNIPDDKLKIISTDQLVKTCLNYPFFGLVFTRNHLQQGYEFIRNNFNGFRELEGRPDAGSGLLKEYIKMKPAGFITESSQAQIGEYMAQFTFIELLLAQYPIINNSNKSVNKLIIEEALEKIKEKSAIKSYGVLGFSTTAFIMGRIINRLGSNFANLKDDEKLEINEFLNNCSLKKNEVLNIIIKETENTILNE